MSQVSGMPIDDLLQSVADAISDAMEAGLDLNQVLSMVAIAATDMGRVAYGDEYVDVLAGTVKLRRGKPLPDQEWDGQALN